MNMGNTPLCLAIALSVITWNAAAITTTGTATATVVKPSFSIHCDALSFGNIIRAKSPGLVTITPNGKRNIRGAVKMGSGGYQHATCQVSGPANTNYTARAPRLLTFTSDGDEGSWKERNRLLVSNIRMQSKNLHKKGNRTYRGKSDEQGKDELYLGATLYVPKNAAPGTYQGIVPVTIHY